MSRPPRTFARIAGLILAAAASLSCSQGVSPEYTPTGNTAPTTVPFQAPPPMSAAQVRSTTREILVDPRFAPKASFWQWLAAQLQRLELPSSGLGGTAGQLLWWAIVVWSVLTLLASVAHIVWTLRGSFGSRRTLPLAFVGELPHLTAQQLRERAQTLAAEGNYPEAVRMLLLGLLRTLDDGGVVRLGEGKTNGDYAREIPFDHPAREPFRVVLTSFDRVSYGGLSCTQVDFLCANSLVEDIARDAQSRP